MTIRNTGIASLIIGILNLIVLFIAIGPIPCAEHFKFGQQEKIILGRIHIALNIATAAHIVRELGYGLHHSPQSGRQSRHKAIGRGAGRCARIAQNGVPHIATCPTTVVGIAGVHAEALAGTSIAIVAITQGNRRGSNLSDLEVNTVVAFTGTVVVEAQNEGIHRQIGKAEPNHIAVDHNGFGITNGPIIIRCPGGACLADGVPIIVIQRGGGQGHGHRTGLVCRGIVVITRRNLHGDCGIAFALGRNRHNVVVYAYACNPRIAAFSRNGAVTGPCNRDGIRHIGSGQGQTAFVQGQTTSGLSNRPRNRFGPGATIIPFVIVRGGKGCVVASRIGAAGGAAKGQFGSVIAIPRRALALSGISKAPALGGGGNIGLADCPLNLFGRGGAVTPLVRVFGGEGCRIGSRIGARSNTAKGQRVGVVAVPRRALRGTRIGQGAILSGYNINGIDEPGHRFQGRICRILGILRRFQGGCQILPNVSVGGFTGVVIINGIFNILGGIKSGIGKLFRFHLAIFPKIGFPGQGIIMGFQGRINFIHVAVLIVHIVEIFLGRFYQIIICGVFSHRSFPF